MEKRREHLAGKDPEPDEDVALQRPDMAQSLQNSTDSESLPTDSDILDTRGDTAGNLSVLSTDESELASIGKVQDTDSLAMETIHNAVAVLDRIEERSRDRAARYRVRKSHGVDE